MFRHSLALFIAGPPGVGKTTLARHVCQRLQEVDPGVAVHIELDNIRYMVLHEAKQPGSATFIWLELAAALAMRAKELARWVVVDGLFYSPEELERLSGVLRAPVLVELSASLETCLRRNERRDDCGQILHAEELRRLWMHRRVGQWRVVDAAEPVGTLTARIVDLAIGAT